jgi:REP element-mobilizing transposase RayT
MAIGYHLVFGAYGFWLPNDPRGSWSKAVWAVNLRPFGPPRRPAEIESVAHVAHDHELRLAAKSRLKYPAVNFTGVQARAIARGIGNAVQKLKIAVFAAAVMPNHVHLVVALHRLSADDLISAFKRFGTRQLNGEQLHPLTAHVDRNGRIPTPWAEGGWKVYVDTHDEMLEAIRYVEENPVKAGLPPQQWPFVTQFEG